VLSLAGPLYASVAASRLMHQWWFSLVPVPVADLRHASRAEYGSFFHAREVHLESSCVKTLSGSRPIQVSTERVHAALHLPFSSGEEM